MFFHKIFFKTILIFFTQFYKFYSYLKTETDIMKIVKQNRMLNFFVYSNQVFLTSFHLLCSSVFYEEILLNFHQKTLIYWKVWFFVAWERFEILTSGLWKFFILCPPLIYTVISSVYGVFFYNSLLHFLTPYYFFSHYKLKWIRAHVGPQQKPR